jgi:GGDEF domain-containing protein
LAGERESRALERDRKAEARDRSATVRDALQDARDLDVSDRDLAAAERDIAAASRDPDAIERDRRAREREGEPQLSNIRVLLSEAATDREIASVDRINSAMDRLEAAEDRIRARAEIVNSLTRDPTTGLPTQGEGIRLLRRELEAHRGEPYAVALMVAHGSPANPDGAMGGLSQAVRAEISGLDVAFCWDGNQIVLGLQNTTSDSAQELLGVVAAGLSHGLSLDAGVTERSGTETAETLIRRAGDSIAAVHPG